MLSNSNARVGETKTINPNIAPILAITARVVMNIRKVNARRRPRAVLAKTKPTPKPTIKDTVMMAAISIFNHLRGFGKLRSQLPQRHDR